MFDIMTVVFYITQHYDKIEHYDEIILNTAHHCDHNVSVLTGLTMYTRISLGTMTCVSIDIINALCLVDTRIT